MARMHWAHTLLALLLASFSAKVAAQPAPTPDNLCNPKQATAQDFASDTRHLSRFIGLYECWQADLTDGRQYYLNDLYTRWIVEEIGSTATAMPRNYRAERRSAIERFFVGRTRGTTVVVKIRMRDPDVDFTVPLLSVDYDGRRGQGEAFSTLLSRSDMGLPDFRISPTTSASIEAKARASNELDVQAAGIVLNTLRDVLTIASPGSSLLTSVNRDQVQRTATAYDTALSRLLSTSIVETATTGRLLSEWRPGNGILVSVDLPDNIRTTVATGSDPNAVRRLWFRISMACPRLSAFDTLNVCEISRAGGGDPLLLASPHFEPALGEAPYVKGQPGISSSEYVKAVWLMHDRISPHQVLSFRLSTGKTLRQFLTEQEWFIALSKALVTVGGKKNREAADLAATSGGATTAGATAALAVQNAGATAPVTTDNDDLRTKIDKAEEFCEAIAEKLYSTGLSRLDSNIGVWAAVTGMPDFATSRSVFQSAPGCRAHLPLSGQYSSWRFAETPESGTPRPAASTRTKPKSNRR